jgi:tetratricopeptide (TPR) repeat protein
LFARRIKHANCLALVCAVVAFLFPVRNARAQDDNSSAYTGISVEPSDTQIFTVMCALDAAGFDVDESNLADMPNRLALRGDLLRMHGPATEELRKFYRDHALSGSAEALSRYLTYALLSSPPPGFELPADRDSLPPDVLFLDGFDEVLAKFYVEAHLDKRWVAVQPEYERATERDQNVVRRIIVVANAYLREITKEGRGSTYTVYVEPLVGNRTTFRSFGNRYGIVAGAGADLPTSEIQHGYLHFILDPLVLKYTKDIQKKRPILDVANKAPLLPQEYQNDMIAFTDECLIKAVELRVHKMPAAQLEATLVEDDKSGFTLVRPIEKQLEVFEKSEPSFTNYFPDLLQAINVQAEQARLKNVTFTPVDQPASAPVSAAAAQNGDDGTDALLEEGDREIAQQQGDKAAETFQEVLKRHPSQPRAMYGLAIASVLVGQADRAMELFQALVSASRPDAQGRPPNTPRDTKIDPSILAWSYVYLGRIHDLQGDRDTAVVEYRDALSVDGAPPSARSAAQHGVDGAYRPPSQAPSQ